MTAFRGFHYIWVLTSQLTDACYMSRPYHPPEFDYSTNTKFPVKSTEIICSVTKGDVRKISFHQLKGQLRLEKGEILPNNVLGRVVSISTSVWEIPFSNFGQVTDILRFMF